MGYESHFAEQTSFLVMCVESFPSSLNILCTRAENGATHLVGTTVPLEFKQTQPKSRTDSVTGSALGAFDWF